MDLNWWIVVIIGCLALAGCIAIALLWPVGTECLCIVRRAVRVRFAHYFHSLS